MKTNGSNPAPRRSRRWMRWFLGGVGALVVVLLVAYFVVGSGFFVRRVLLPRVGTELGAKLTAGQAAFRPFSQLELWDVKLAVEPAAPPGSAEPLFTAAHLRVRYRLGELLGGKLALEELTLESPTLTVEQNAEGASNLDPILKKVTARGRTPTAKPPSAEPATVLDLKRITVTNATVWHVVTGKDGSRQAHEVRDFALVLSDLKNGATGRVSFSGALAMEQRDAASEAPRRLRAGVAGEFSLGLSPELQLTGAQGGATFRIQEAADRWAELAGLNLQLQCDITPGEVKTLRLACTRQDVLLGEAVLKGPLDFAKLEGRLDVALQVQDRRVLNLLAAGGELKFDVAALVSTNTVEIAQGGQRFVVTGQFDARDATLTRQNATTPKLTLHAHYELSYDRAASTALLRALNLTADQESRPLVRVRLSAPLSLALRGSGAEAGEAALELELADLNLADWRAFAPELDPAGRVQARAQLLARHAGQELHLNLQADSRSLSARFGTQTVAQVDAKLSARGALTGFEQLKLDAFELHLAHQDRPALSASGNATASWTNRAATAQLTLRGAIAPLLALWPQPAARLQAGEFRFEGNVSYSPQQWALAGRASLAGLEGSVGEVPLHGWDAGVQFELEQRGDEIEVRKASGQWRVGGQPAGGMELSGRAKPAAGSAQLALRLSGVNEAALRPFLQSALGEKQLASLALDSSLNASVDGRGHAALQGQLQITNLVVRDPGRAWPSEPLEARAQVDLVATQSVFQIRQAQLALTPTARARNELRLTGRVEARRDPASASSPQSPGATAPTNGPLRLRGALELSSEALDLTRYYEWFPGDTAAGSTAGKTVPAPPSTPAPEPAPTQLPFEGLELKIAVARLWLRELEAQNATLSLRLDRSAVQIPAVRLSLNGAPVEASAEADLSVPGYRYRASWKADGVQVAPLADSFSPTYRGRANGTMFTQGRLQGAGFSGRSLREHLEGEAQLVFTNANIQIVGPKARAILTPIALVLGTSELLDSPLETMQATIHAGGGQIRIGEFFARSPTFVVRSQGVIPIAEVLRDSPLNQELEVSVARALATKLRLANVPTNVAYVKLPSFARLRGTLGNPDVKTDKAAILALTATSLGGAVGGTAGRILEGVGTLLGVPPGPTASPAASAPTNTPSATTNVPASPPTNAPPPPNPVEDILNLFKRPRR